MSCKGHLCVASLIMRFWAVQGQIRKPDLQTASGVVQRTSRVMKGSLATFKGPADG